MRANATAALMQQGMMACMSSLSWWQSEGMWGGLTPDLQIQHKAAYAAGI